MRRTLYTCLLGFSRPDFPTASMAVIAVPELQETSALPCDIGSPLALLETEFSRGKWAGRVDFGLVSNGWNNKSAQTLWAPDPSKIEARAKATRQWLRQLGNSSGVEDVHMVVVTHGTCLHYLTEDWAGSDKFIGTGWRNAEFRSYTFCSDDDDNASIVEMKESRERRGGNETLLTATEQKQLRMMAEETWEKSGFHSTILN